MMQEIGRYQVDRVDRTETADDTKITATVSPTTNRDAHEQWVGGLFTGEWKTPADIRVRVAPDLAIAPGDTLVLAIVRDEPGDEGRRATNDTAAGRMYQSGAAIGPGLASGLVDGASLLTRDAVRLEGTAHGRE